MVDPSFVFIASTAYSGSTLLSYLLGAHPEIATVSDVSGTRRADRMADYLCSCQARMLDCEFWASLQSRMHARGFGDFVITDFRLGFDYDGRSLAGRLRTAPIRFAALDSARNAAVGVVWPGHERRIRAIAARNEAFARAVLEETGASVFVDASKERMRSRYLFRYLNMELKVIHLVRDVRGVVESTVRRGKRGDLSLTGVARAWAKTHRVIIRNLESIPPDHRILVRYEDLCRDPDGELARLFAFCGVDPTVRIEDFRARQQHLLGNKMRLDGSSAIRLDERWRDTFTTAEQESIRTAAGSTFERLYPGRAVP
jgi:hypothetical protein